MISRGGLAKVLLAAGVFGLLVAAFKGQSSGLRDVLGNVSAPWLLLPFFAGRTCRGPVRGAVMGTAASLAAVGTFYATESVVLDLGPHPWVVDLGLTLRAGLVIFAAGVVFGPFFGALGGTGARRRSLVTAAVVGLSLVGEPLAVFVWQRSRGVSAADSSLVIHYPALWVGEVCLGLVASAVIVLTAHRKSVSRETRLRAANR
jgi:hypothetical protein